MLTPQQLRSDYPEFTSTVTYPNSAITYWLTVAYSMLNADRWGRQLDLGAAMFVAHNLVLEAKVQAEAKVGGIPGGQVGPINSKSVDKVSLGYDTAVGIVPDAGHWNLSIYGTRFIKLARMMGAGPIQLGVGASPYGSGPAWPGPWPFPSPTGFTS